MSPGTLDDTARWITRARWLELQCFEILGGWVTSTPEPEVKLALARQSHHHAWHAELFERVLPAANGFSSDRFKAAPPAWSDFIADLRRIVTTADRLAGVFGLLLPAKLAEYEQWLDVVDPVRDGPLRRWLGFVVADERADLAEGRMLRDGVAAGDRLPARAGLEASLLRAGPLLA